MLRVAFGVFVVLHGLVHLLYLGQSRRFFELQPGMIWPDGTWAFSRLLGSEATRTLAGALLVISALGFLLSGVGLFLMRDWWRPVLVAVAGFSAISYLLLWDGHFQNLADKGAVGILINLAILVVVLMFQWPSSQLVDG